MQKDNSFAERVIAFAAVEGILFSGSFCAIYWLKKCGLMPGLTFSKEPISRDEGLHTEFACMLYTMLQNPLPDNVVHDVIKGAVKAQRTFICEALSCDLIGVNNEIGNQCFDSRFAQGSSIRSRSIICAHGSLVANVFS